MSSDGAKVLYMTLENRKRTVHVGGVSGGATQKVCEECLALLSPDGSRVFYASHPGCRQTRGGRG